MDPVVQFFEDASAYCKRWKVELDSTSAPQLAVAAMKPEAYALSLRADVLLAGQLPEESRQGILQAKALFARIINADPADFRSVTQQLSDFIGSAGKVGLGIGAAGIALVVLVVLLLALK